MKRLGIGHWFGMALLAVLVPRALGAQASSAPATSGNAGGFNSRFIPVDVWTRMLERPENINDFGFKVQAPADSVWAALTDVMKLFDIPIGYTDRRAGEMGAVKAKMYKRLGKSAISEFLRCGEGTSGPNADMYVVYISVAAFVKSANEAETSAAVFISGDAVDLPNGRNDVVPCTSSGQFESKFAAAVKKRMLSQTIKQAKPGA